MTQRSSRAWTLSEISDQDFAFLKELRDLGHTGYAVMPLLGAHGRVHVLSIATKKPGGFEVTELDAIKHYARHLSLLVDSLALYHLAEVILSLYVGPKTGSRVLSGEVRRGQGDIIEAVVLISDMKGFTEICADLTAKETIHLLNQFFERICQPIENRGGEILKFMGDAVLAIFSPGAKPIQESCRDALRASRLAHQRLNEAPLTLPNGSQISVGAGFALHVGQFHYGNIGASNRLDFTAIGTAVNLASRIESKSRLLQSDILCTRRFASLAGVSGKSLGYQQLKGISEPTEIISLIVD